MIVGNWQVVADPTAAAGARLSSMDLRGQKGATIKAAAGDYVELSFNAEAGRPYRLWIRGAAEGNHPGNDSVYVQFDGAVNATGSPLFRSGSSSATTVILENCNNCGGLDGWGWQDNGSDPNSLGPAIYFESTGPQKVRVLVREDGISIDQIVLSPSAYLTKSPGLLKLDSTILDEIH